MSSIRSAAGSSVSTKILRFALATGIAVTATLGFAGCTNGKGQTNELIGPVIVDLANIDGTQVNVSIDNVVDLSAGDTDVTAWTGTVADPEIAKFIPGKRDGSSGSSPGVGAVFNPGIQPLKMGNTKVTVTNSTSKKSQTFTLVVTQ